LDFFQLVLRFFCCVGFKYLYYVVYCMAKRTFSFRASDELLGKFIVGCEAQGLKPSVVCRRMVEDWVKELSVDGFD